MARILGSWCKRQARRIAGIIITLAAFAAMHVAEYPVRANGDAVASQFAFSRSSLPDVPGPAIRYVRNMHPALRHIAGYMSVFGAAAALSDLDGDGLANDACYVDTRTDQVIVSPVPGTGNRFSPFSLNFEVAGRILFDRDRMAAMGCLAGDIDEDGRMDLVVYFAGRSPILFLSQRTEDGDTSLGPKNFVPVEIIPVDQVWVTGSATLADLDGDGHLELVIVNYFGDGSDIYNPKATTPVAMPDSLGRAFNGGGPRIYRCVPTASGSEHPVRCTEVVDALPKDLPKGWGLAVAAYDLDQDLLPEIYIANDYGPDRLLWNRSTPGQIRFELVEGERTLRTPISRVLGRDSYHSMGVDFADLNGDGIPDIFVSNITSPLAVQEGQVVFLSTGSTAAKVAQGIAPYIEAAESLGLSRSGWAWDAKLDDFNNDGVMEAIQAVGYMKGPVDRWADFAELGLLNDELIKYPRFWPPLGPEADISGHQRNPFYVRVGEKYVDISERIGFGEENPSRGIAIADVDGDGRLDIVVANMWGPATYYHNECASCGNFLGLHLRLAVNAAGPASTTVRSGHPDRALRSRPAIGASVTVTMPDGRKLTRQVDGGNGMSGKRSPDLHFGLGKENGAVRVDVRWRDANGTPQQETHQLNPGWYTLLLGTHGRAASAQ